MEKPMNNEPIKFTGLQGVITKERYRLGTKSEADMHVLTIYADTQTFVIRRKAGPAFGDRTLDKFINKRVIINGWMLGNTILAEDIKKVKAA
jgi:hypothetical protein